MSASPMHSTSGGAARNAQTFEPHRAPPRMPHANGARHLRTAQLVLTDDELRRKLRDRLSQFGTRISRDVRVDVRCAEVVLAGVVDGEYERQLIEQSMARIAGVGTIVNLLDIDSGESQDAAREDDVTALRTPRRTALVAAAVAGLLAMGWSVWRIAAAVPDGGEVPIAGTVRIAGIPAAGAVLTLHPLSPRGRRSPVPQGRVDVAGNIEWTFESPGDGLPPGDYAVTVAWPGDVAADGEPRRPSHAPLSIYGRVESSPLRVRVDPGARCWIAFDLSR